MPTSRFSIYSLLCGLLWLLGCGEEDAKKNNTVAPVGRMTAVQGTASTMTTTRTLTATTATATATGVSTATATATATDTAPGGPEIVITEVAPFPDPAFANKEWFEIFNTTTKPINLDRWLYTDTCTYLSRGMFPPMTMIGPGEYFQVLIEGGVVQIGDPEPDLCVSDSLARIVAVAAWKVDQLPPGTSLGRWPGASGDFYAYAAPSPGKPNPKPLTLQCGNGTLEEGEACDGSLFGAVDSCQGLGYVGGALGCQETCRFDESACQKQPGEVVINEVVSSMPDAIELLNVGKDAVNLENWRVGSQFYPRFESSSYRFGKGETILPGEYRLLKRASTMGVQLYLRDEVTLYDAMGRVVDRVVYEEDKAQVSYCRMPDGTGEFRSCIRATLAKSNAL